MADVSRPHVLVDPEDEDLLSGRWSLNHKGYVQFHHGGTTRGLHSVIAERSLGPRPDGMQVDHINHDRLDNRRSNLRYLTPSDNNRHRPGRRGVDRRRGKFRARGYLNDREHYLGTFEKEWEARRAVARFQASHPYEGVIL